MMRKTFSTLVLLMIVAAQLFGGWQPFAAAQPPAETPPPSAESGTLPQADPVSSLGLTNTIQLKSRTFKPGAPEQSALDGAAASPLGKKHVLVQLDFIPGQKAKDELAGRGLRLLAYVPDYAWIAALESGAANDALSLPGVAWVGELQLADKLDESIRLNRWGSWNRKDDGTVAIYVMMHQDEGIETGRGLVARHGGKVMTIAYGANLLVVEIPETKVSALAAEEAVQWIEPAAPGLGPANDGIRGQIGVNTLFSAPYNLNGSGVDILIYDSTNVAAHTDFGTRLWSAGDDSGTDREHSTHVAGTAAGAGTVNSTYRGMAPAANIISYGTGWTGGILFYEDVGDIEAEFSAAQNNRGADVANASIGSNVYANYPSSCYLYGNYGASDVVMDQMIRGGNATMGIGDKIIVAWAAGNERSTSCSATGYNTIAPPGSAKNPIHVGAINTNNNSMTSFTSWGPTDDGRIKPTIVSGGCQSTGDLGITSTDNSPVNGYTTMCGTSMASPSVAGSIALMLQAYRLQYNTTGNFWPSTAKALLIQTATDLGNAGPDYQNGYGLVNIQAAVDLINRRGFTQASMNSGDYDYYSVVVSSSATPLRVSLAWDDRETTANANPTLINNLDLQLTAPDGTVWQPYILDPANPATAATRGTDSRNNQEQVEVTSPAVGTWTVRVRATSVPQAPQEY
jgi:subtilisin family serine protease